MLGRSKLVTKQRASCSASRLTISSRVAAVGGRGQRHPGRVGKTLGEHRQADVLGPEIVAPLRDAVRLVDGDEGDLRLRQQRKAALGQQALRRHVEQVQAALTHGALDVRGFSRTQRRIEERRPHARFLQRCHLVLHQRDQGRHDDADPGPDQRRNLVAQRLAAAGGHQHQGVPARAHMLDDGLLGSSELAVAEHPAQGFESARRRRGLVRAPAADPTLAPGISGLRSRSNPGQAAAAGDRSGRWRRPTPGTRHGSPSATSACAASACRPR